MRSGGNCIIGLCPRLFTHQVISKATISNIGAVKPASGNRGVEIAHSLRSILKPHHRCAHRRLDNGVARSLNFRPRQKADSGTTITQYQRCTARL